MCLKNGRRKTLNFESILAGKFPQNKSLNSRPTNYRNITLYCLEISVASKFSRNNEDIRVFFQPIQQYIGSPNNNPLKILEIEY